MTASSIADLSTIQSTWADTQATKAVKYFVRSLPTFLILVLLSNRPVKSVKEETEPMQTVAAARTSPEAKYARRHHHKDLEVPLITDTELEIQHSPPQ